VGVAALAVYPWISGTIDLYYHDRNNMSGEREEMHLIRGMNTLLSNFLQTVVRHRSIVPDI
jgi:hypothetical protein